MGRNNNNNGEDWLGVEPATAGTHMKDLKAVFRDNKRADGKIYFKPAGKKRGAYRGFYQWIKFLKLDKEACIKRYYRDGWSTDRIFSTPIREYKKPRRD